MSLASFADEIDVSKNATAWPCFETKKDWSGYDPVDPSGDVPCGAWRAGSTSTESNDEWLDSNGDPFQMAIIIFGLDSRPAIE